jgi:Cyclin, N-terminal domain
MVDGLDDDSASMVQDQIRMLLQQQERIYQKGLIDYMAHERQKSYVSLSDDSSTSSNGMNKVNSTTSISDVKDVASIDFREPQNWRAPSPPLKLEQTFTYWRQQMFDWSCMVVDSYGIERQVVAMSFNLLDRYVGVECGKLHCAPITREDYQLFSMTCLYLSIKIIESHSRKISIQTLVDMSKGYYSRAVIEATERDILHALNWYVHAPTSIGFVRLFSQLWQPKLSFSMEAMATRFTEMAVADSYLCLQRPSLIGLASLLHAARIEGVPDAELQHFCQQVQGLLSLNTECPEFRRIYVLLSKLYYD